MKDICSPHAFASPIRHFDAGESAAFDIPAPVLEYCQAESKRIRSIDLSDGSLGDLKFTTHSPGRYAAVIEGLPNDLPPATHWDSNLNEPRHGASDGIGTIDGVFEKMTRTISWDSDSPCFYPPEKKIFANGALVPSVENYVGMSYSLYHATFSATALLSSRCLQRTGFGAVFRNPDSKVLESVPFFQVISNIPLSFEGHPSLASVILPPGWKLDGDPCPILFCGFYDTNSNVFYSHGLEAMEALKAIKDAGRLALAVMWNGGGAEACMTVQPSAHGGMNAVFDMLKERFNADTSMAISCGSSRGGLTALHAAANPNPSYTLKAVVACNPPMHISEADMISPYTFPLHFAIQESCTGWKMAYLKHHSQEDPQLVLSNLTGLSPEETRAVLGAESPSWMGEIKKKDPYIHIQAGTQDYMAPLYPQIRFVETAQKLGLRLRFELAFRAGHYFIESPFSIAARLMASFLTDAPLPEEGVFLNKRKPVPAFVYEPYNGPFPVFASYPKEIPAGFPYSIELFGPPGSIFKVSIQRQGDAPNPIRILQTPGEPALGGLASRVFETRKSWPFAPGEYDWIVECLPPGQNWFSPKVGDTRFTVTETEIEEPGVDKTIRLSVGKVGPGICEV
jgi:hypothetical protein